MQKQRIRDWAEPYARQGAKNREWQIEKSRMLVSTRKQRMRDWAKPYPSRDASMFTLAPIPSWPKNQLNAEGPDPDPILDLILILFLTWSWSLPDPDSGLVRDSSRSFSVTMKRLYKTLCWSVRWSVCPSVGGPSVIILLFWAFRLTRRDCSVVYLRRRLRLV